MRPSSTSPRNWIPTSGDRSGTPFCGGGTVVAVGPGKLLDSGERSALSVEVGDEILFGKYGGTDIEVDGEEVKILRESDILAKVV